MPRPYPKYILLRIQTTDLICRTNIYKERREIFTNMQRSAVQRPDWLFVKARDKYATFCPYLEP